MHVFGHDQKHLHRAETLPKFKHNDFACKLLLTDRHRYSRDTLQTMISIITNAVYIPCHKRAETLPKYKHNDLAQKDMKIQSVHLVRNAHNELKRFQTSGTMV